MKLDINLKFNKLTPNFFFYDNIAMKLLLASSRSYEKNRAKKMNLNLKNTVNIFDCAPEIYSSRKKQNCLKYKIKPIDSRLVKRMRYQKIASLKLPLHYSNNFFKYDLILKNRFYCFQNKLWLQNYALNYLFYDTFTKNKTLSAFDVQTALPKIDSTTGQNIILDFPKVSLKYDEMKFNPQDIHRTTKKSNCVWSMKSKSTIDSYIPDVIWLWIEMLISQIQFETFRCATYCFSQNVFKLQTLFSKSWSARVFLFFVSFYPFCTMLQTTCQNAQVSSKKEKENHLRIESFQLDIPQFSPLFSNPTQKQEHELIRKKTNESNDSLLKLKRVVDEQTKLYELNELVADKHKKKQHNTIRHFFSTMFICEQNFKLKELFKQYFLFVIVQSQWETKNNSYCYDLRPGTNVYDCIDSLFRCLKPGRKFIFHTKISFSSPVDSSFRFQMPNETLMDLSIDSTNNKLIDGASRAQDFSKIRLNENLWRTSSNEESNQQKFSNKSTALSQLEHSMYKQRALNFNSFCSKIHLNDLENQLVDCVLKNIYEQNVLIHLSYYILFHPLVFTCMESQKGSIRVNNTEKKVDLAFGVRFSYKIEPKKTNMFVPTKQKYLFYKPNLIAIYEKKNRRNDSPITFMYYPSGIYKKPKYSFLFYQLPRLKIPSLQFNNNVQQSNIINSKMCYNEHKLLFEKRIQKQKRLCYNRLQINDVSRYAKLSDCFVYSLIQYESQLLLISSNKHIMTPFIELLQRWFTTQNSKLNVTEIKSHTKKFGQKQNKDKNTGTADGVNFFGFHMPNAAPINKREKKIADGMKAKIRLSRIYSNRKKLIKSHFITPQIDRRQMNRHRNEPNKHLEKKRRKNATPLLLFPSKSNINNYLQHIKSIIKNHKTNTQEFLIDKLAHKINLWCYYYRIISNKKIFYYCDYIIFKWLWRWCCRRHPNKRKSWIKHKYFHFTNNKNWNFCVYKNSTKSFYCLPKNSQIKLVRHLKIPEHHSIYDKNWKLWLQRFS